MCEIYEWCAAGIADRMPGTMLLIWKYRQTWSGISARTCLARAAGDA